MSNKLICPECGTDKFSCQATIAATLVTYSDSAGMTDYELREWDDIETIEYFCCQRCDFEFEGDEDEFREYLESAHTGVSE